MGVFPLVRLPQHIVFDLIWFSPPPYVQNHLLVG